MGRKHKVVEKNSEFLLCQELRACKHLQDIVMRQDLIGGLTSKLLASSLSIEIDKKQQYIVSGMGRAPR